MKTYKTKHNLDKVCFYLIIRGKEFNYCLSEGVTFQADEDFVKNMKKVLVTAYGCSLPPVINEVK